MSVADLKEQLARTEQLVTQLKEHVKEKDNELRSKEQCFKVLCVFIKILSKQLMKMNFSAVQGVGSFSWLLVLHYYFRPQISATTIINRCTFILI